MQMMGELFPSKMVRSLNISHSRKSLPPHVTRNTGRCCQGPLVEEGSQ